MHQDKDKKDKDKDACILERSKCHLLSDQLDPVLHKDKDTNIDPAEVAMA